MPTPMPKWTMLTKTLLAVSLAVATASTAGAQPTDPYGDAQPKPAKQQPAKQQPPKGPVTPGPTQPADPYGPPPPKAGKPAPKPGPTTTQPAGPTTGTQPADPYGPAAPTPKPGAGPATKPAGPQPGPATGPTDPYATPTPLPKPPVAKPPVAKTPGVPPTPPTGGPAAPADPYATPAPQPAKVVARVGISDLTAVQGLLAVQRLDGWLLTDRDGSNPIAVRLVAPDGHPTRPWFYIIPARGTPVLLAHSAELRSFDHLAGTKLVYQGYRDLDKQLKVLLKGLKSVAVEYSPKAAVPAVSRVDGGTLEVIRAAGVTVKSSDTLVQFTKAIWGDPGRTAHYVAAHHIVELRKEALAFVTKQLLSGAQITEYDVQQRLVRGMTMRGLVGAPPVVAAGVNTADPYYVPSAVKSAMIKRGDPIVISLAAKLDKAEGIYAAQTWVAVADSVANDQVVRAFQSVALARDQALALIAERAAKKRPVTGAEVDQATRAMLKKAGFADRVLHRTGHSIDSDLQGGGADLDDYEVKDSRIMTAGTGFTIGPGVYFPGAYGVRSETSVYLTPTGPEVTMAVQDELELLLKR